LPGTEFYVEVLCEALGRFCKPEIFNADQRAQFMVMSFTDVLKSQKVQIGMAGRGRVQDNIFIKRLWWSLKYQYL
jgi:putative transposase